MASPNPTNTPLSFLLVVVLFVGCGVNAQSDACDSNLDTFLPAPFNSSGLRCKAVWNDFVLRYSQDQDNVLSIILSSTYTSGWVGMGFSKDGMMVGSSAMVGWIGRDHKAHIRQYYLGGQTGSKVVVNKGELQTVANSLPSVTIFGAKLYMAFQLKFPTPVARQSLLFAFGTAIPTKYVLTQHEDKASISFDFSAGPDAASATSDVPSVVSTYPYQLKRNHGILGILGWGLFLPIGVLVARHCKQWDPLWYYLHVGIQFFGFILGFAGVVAGIALYDKIHADVQAHRGLGIFVLVLAILQVIAFFVRPNKDSKYRKYWKWYHQWAGRLALFLAAVNTVIGIRAGNAGQSWRVGYGINLAIFLIASITLEIIFWLRSSNNHDITSSPPTF